MIKPFNAGGLDTDFLIKPNKSEAVKAAKIDHSVTKQTQIIERAETET